MPFSQFSDDFRRLAANIARRQQGILEPSRKWIVILASLILAFFLWLSFSLRETYTVVIDMPIEIGRLPEGQALREQPPRIARVTIQGVGSELLRIQRNPPPLVIHAQSDQVDVFAAASESPRLPSGLSVQSASPAVIQLALEAEEMKMVPVHLDMHVELAQDHDFIGPPVIQPDSVRISGAASILANLDRFPTSRMSMSNARETIQVRLPLSDTLRGLVRTGISAIDVSVPVGAYTEAVRELSLLVEDVPPDAMEVILRPAIVQTTFRVPVDQYQRAMDSQEIVASIPYGDILADTTGSLTPVIQIPQNLIMRDVRLSPSSVGYYIRID